MINDKGEFGKVSKIKNKKIKKTNILLGFICILLAVLLGFILVTSYKSEQKESRHLSEIADDQQSGIEDYEAVRTCKRAGGDIFRRSRRYRRH